MKQKVFAILLIGSLASCSATKETASRSSAKGASKQKGYISKVFIDDAEMKLSLKKVEKAENAFLLYREGASGVNGGKSGGGCGCN